MPKVKSFDAINALKKSTQLQEGMDIIPDDMQNTIVPVIDITPRKHRVSQILGAVADTTTGTKAAFTADSKQETFITGVQVAYAKDATCDQATGVIKVQCTQDGVTRIIHQFPVITLTAQSDDMFLVFPIPLRIDKSSPVNFTGTFTVGVMSRTLQVFGYVASNPQN